MHNLPADERTFDADLRNAAGIFEEAWQRLKQRHGEENLRFPKEIIWLGGAPGAGKGTNTPLILRERGIRAAPIVMSSLLNTPEMVRLKDQGRLIGDGAAVEILLESLLRPEYRGGVLVDGFPRTSAQCGCVRMLYAKMLDLRSRFFDSPFGVEFRRPIFRVVVLFVTEQVAVDRQLKRGRQVIEHNRVVRESGQGELQEERVTDADPAHASERYRIFRVQTFDALQRLRDFFQYHIIDANGDIREVEGNIVRELQYQSSLELGSDTHDAIRNIPLASSLAEQARQELVRRLDHNRARRAEQFMAVIDCVERYIVPALERDALAGHAHVRVRDAIFDREGSVEMVLDILTERGFFPTVELIEIFRPMRVDLTSGAIETEVVRTWHFEINFKHRSIRRD